MNLLQNTPPVPLEKLTLSPRSHLAALWWLGWLYRNPQAFADSANQLPRRRALLACAKLYLHALPWLWGCSVVGRAAVFFFGTWHPDEMQSVESWLWILNSSSRALVIGVIFGLVLGVPFGFPHGGLVSGLLFGVAAGSGELCNALVIGLSLGLGAGLSHGLAVDVIRGLSIGLFLGLVFGFVFGLDFDVFGKFDPGFGLGVLIGFEVGWLRLYYLLLHGLSPLLRYRSNTWRFHPAAWDWTCLVPFPFLDRLLVGYAESAPARMEVEIRRLIVEVPGQRQMALRAQATIRAREASRVRSLLELSTVLSDLPEGHKGFLAQTRRVRELAEAIVQQQLRVDETTRPHFREVETNGLVAAVRNFSGIVGGFREPLVSGFSRAAEHWLKLAEAQQFDAARRVGGEPVPQVFRAGDPVDPGREAFVPRLRTLGEIEGQIMLAGGCPGVLLRAPRRTGKSSLLKNVTGFLPGEVCAAFVSLQSAQAFSSTGHFAAFLAGEVGRALPEAVRSLAPSRQSQVNELALLQQYLGDVNGALDGAGRRLLLAIDEYEMIDEKLREGVFPRDLLALVRESIQSHRRITWAFSGNADITELSGADWTSYPISVRTIEVPFFSQDETHLLLTNPLKHSRLGDADLQRLTLVWREFWGEDGIERIHAEGGGWPYFVQLVAETAVQLINDQPAKNGRLTPALLEAALDESVVRGTNAFHNLLRSQGRLPAEWEFLSAFAKRESQPLPQDEPLRRALRRRKLLIEEGETCRLRVPLMARWLRKEA